MSALAGAPAGAPQRRCWGRVATTLLLALAASLAAAGPPATVPAGEFLHPHNLALTPDGTQLLVADMGNDVVKILDPESLAVRGEIGAGFLSGPHDLAFASDGALLVADTNNDRIVRFVPTPVGYRHGGILATGLGFPESLVTGPDGKLWVAGTGAGRLALLDPTGKTLATARAAGGRGFRQPHGIRADGRGRLIACDADNNRLVVFDRRLRVLRIVDGQRIGLAQPKALHVEPDGTIFVTDEKTGSVHVFDARFAPRAVLGDGRLRHPEGVVVRGRDLWVADTFNNRIVRLRLAEPPRRQTSR